MSVAKFETYLRIVLRAHGMDDRGGSFLGDLPDQPLTANDLDPDLLAVLEEHGITPGS